MEYIFQLGSFPKLSLAEIINVLSSEQLDFDILDVSDTRLHINIQNINPQILLEILGGTKAIIHVTTGETYTQDIKAYQKREFKKPKSDPKSGLLPAKLSKILINLSFTKDGVHTIYDPFCGSGTIITEANVMGVKGIGSDVDPKTISDARQNAIWIAQEYQLPEHMSEFFVSDVRSIDVEDLKQKHIDAIVSEPYLGRPVSKTIRMGSLVQNDLKHVDSLIRAALQKASAILPVGKRVVIIIPCFKTRKGIVKLDISHTYNRYSFKRVNILENIDKDNELLYFRPKAVVLREVFILEKV